MDRFFSKSAARYAKRFRKKGPDKPSRVLIDALSSLGVREKRVLDIGCGTGDVHLTLLDLGAAFAEGIDISSGMLAQARNLSREMGHEGRVAYRQGDFMDQSTEVLGADIVILDKVLCCYESPEALIRESASKSGEFLALSYPSTSFLAAVSFRFMNWIGRLLRWSFYPFYHDPRLLLDIAVSSSLHPVFSDRTVLWQITILRRDR